MVRPSAVAIVLMRGCPSTCTSAAPSGLKARIARNHRVSLCQHGGPYKPELNIAGDGNLNFRGIVVGKLGDQILR
jgi:hypothetical protein